MHAAYTNRKETEYDLQQLLDQVRQLATVVSSTAPFWAFNPTVSISEHFATLLGALRSIFQGCLATLGRMELMIACGAVDVHPRSAFGADSIDAGILHWKLQSYIDATELARRRGSGESIDIQQLRQQGSWYQVAGDRLDGRREIGDLLLLEIVSIEDHVGRVEGLVVAAKVYTEAVQRVDSTALPAESAPEGAKTNPIVVPEITQTIPIDAFETLAAIPRSLSDKDEILHFIERMKDQDDVDYETVLDDILRRLSPTVTQKVSLAKALYTGGKITRAIQLLQLPLNELQIDPIASASANHLLARPTLKKETSVALLITATSALMRGWLISDPTTPRPWSHRN
ncbi:uncharacterized protein BJX67DRAFT_313318 [Aspergillus lucknowensis]|uniref:Uncharacterized protein n=1 Tax=Aspergillus lucknowensis TaxID=176173 RepID=A0ABR4L9I3_9EURO